MLPILGHYHEKEAFSLQLMPGPRFSGLSNRKFFLKKAIYDMLIRKKLKQNKIHNTNYQNPIYYHSYLLEFVGCLFSPLLCIYTLYFAHSYLFSSFLVFVFFF